RFFGFDEDQHADITFVAQAPSGSGQVVHADHNVLTSDDPAAGGPNDEDATIPYHVLGTTGPGAAIDLSGLTASNQGYHLKVMSDSVEAPGGAKQKVFWVDCAPTGASPVMPSASSAELSALLAASSESIVRSLLEVGGSSVGA